MILWGTQSQRGRVLSRTHRWGLRKSCKGRHRALWSSVLRISTVKHDSGNLTQYLLGSRMVFAQQASFQRVWKQGRRHGSVALSGDRNVPSLIVSCGRPADFVRIRVVTFTSRCETTVAWFLHWSSPRSPLIPLCFYGFLSVRQTKVEGEIQHTIPYKIKKLDEHG